ncbi:MAG: DUF5000 domain-containing lipoprotein [Cyclobacteriaceae bacterium]
MKSLNIASIIALFVVFLFACTEDTQRGPLAIEDEVAPGIVSEISVENLPGGALVTYKIPSDEDFLLVEATYQRNVTTVVTKSSAYQNSILIEGIRGVENLEVELVSVDRSGNRSPVTTVTVNPLTAPIDKMFNELTLEQAFGGVRANYSNNELLKFELLLLLKDTVSGEWQYTGSAFIENNQRNRFTFRGFPPSEKTFGIFAVDRWDNSTDTLEISLTPLEEVELDFTKYDVISPALSTDEPDAFGWVHANMWNGNIGGNGFHTSQANPGAVVPPYEEPYHIVSWDLGVTANLSRVIWWQRQGSWGFRHGNPRYFEIWGIDELPANSPGTDMVAEGWTLLVANGEVLKPSEAPLGTLSAEDAAQVLAGEEFEIFDNSAKIRYLRFVNFQSWSGAKFMHMTEVKAFGQILEE